MYKLFVVLVLAAIGFMFWRMGPGNDVTYYESKDGAHAETAK